MFHERVIHVVYKNQSAPDKSHNANVAGNCELNVDTLQKNVTKSDGNRYFRKFFSDQKLRHFGRKLKELSAEVQDYVALLQQLCSKVMADDAKLIFDVLSRVSHV